MRITFLTSIGSLKLLATRISFGKARLFVRVWYFFVLLNLPGDSALARRTGFSNGSGIKRVFRTRGNVKRRG